MKFVSISLSLRDVALIRISFGEFTKFLSIFSHMFFTAFGALIGNLAGHYLMLRGTTLNFVDKTY